LLKPFLLLVREAGGKISEEENFIVVSNWCNSSMK
jgi:hypothetical protein